LDRQLQPAERASPSRAPSDAAEARQAVLAAKTRGEIKLEDPLDRHRASLDSQADRIADRAHEYTREQQLGRRSEEWLWRKVRHTHGALQGLPQAVQEKQGIDRLRDAHGHEVHSMFNRLAGIAPDNRDAIPTPDDARVSANPARDDAEAAKSSMRRRGGAVSLEQLDAREQAMRDEGRHPDQLQEQAAQWLAARRELEIRREMARQRTRETGQVRSAERMAPDLSIRAPAVEMGGPGIGG
jgi:hypothetical protein